MSQYLELLRYHVGTLQEHLNILYYFRVAVDTSLQLGDMAVVSYIFIYNYLSLVKGSCYLEVNTSVYLHVSKDR